MSLDVALFRCINNLAGRNQLLDAFGIFCSKWLIFVMFGVVLMRACIVAQRPESRGLMTLLITADIRGGIAGVTAFAGNWLISLVWFRPRPYVTLPNVHLLIPHQLTAHAFPSGHSSAAFALAFIVLLVDLPLGMALLACASGVAFGRVFTGVHYPTDVLAGVLVGLVWALAFHGLGSHLHDIDMVKKLLNKAK